MFYAQPLSHISFILKPESDLVKEAMWSLNATNGGIEAFPICGYILHSLFLKLTGAQAGKWLAVTMITATIVLSAIVTANAPIIRISVWFITIS